MPLAAYIVEKYRSFVRPAAVELRPLTLLFGYNSAGKSALLRALPLLASSMDPSIPGPLALGSEAARGATFSDIKSHLDKGSFLHFSLEWDDASAPIRRVELRLFDVENLREQVIERVRAFDAGGALLLEVEWDPVDGTAARGPSRYQARLGEGAPFPVLIEFTGLIPRVPSQESSPAAPAAQVREFLQQIQQRFNSLRSSIHWLGSLRVLPPRRSDYLGRPRSMQPSGQEAAAILAYDKRGEGKLLRRVSEWYESSTGHVLDIVEEAGQFSVVLSPLKGAPVRINLVDTAQAGETAQLATLFGWGLVGKHRIQVEDDQASEFRAWLEGLGAELRDAYQAVLDIGYELDSREPSRHEVRVARVNAPDFSRRLPRLPLRLALQFLLRPFRVVLENSRADRNFLFCMGTKEQQDFLLRGEREGFIEFENGNGLESMGERALGFGTDPHAPLPALLSFFLFDSDALQPGQPSKQSQQLKQTCDQTGVPHYQLRRRFIESYLPLRALGGWVNLAPNREGRVQRRERYEAFLQLKRPEQRHHYNLKRGFEGDQKRIEQGETAGALFEGLIGIFRSSTRPPARLSPRWISRATAAGLR